jgi:hypothetical protein
MIKSVHFQDCLPAGVRLPAAVRSDVPPSPQSHSQSVKHDPGTSRHPVLAKNNYVLPDFAVRSTLFKATNVKNFQDYVDEMGLPTWIENQGQDGYQHFYRGRLLTVHHGLVYGHVIKICWPHLESGDRVYFKFRSLLTMMGKKTGGSNYRSIKSALEVLSACELSLGSEKRNISGKLLEFAYDEQKRSYYFKLPKWISKTLLAGEYTILDSIIVESIEGSTAKSLYQYFTSHDSALGNGHKLDFLRTSITGSRARKDVFRRRIPSIAKQFLELGVFSSAEFTNDKLIYILPAKPKSLKQRTDKEIKKLEKKSTLNSSTRPPPRK